MAKEIERKFLVRDLAVTAGHRGAHIVQGYLASEPMTVRVRIKDAAAFLTLKSRGGIERDEYEFPIGLSEARELLARHCGGRVVEKTRYCIPAGRHTIEVDVFAGHLTGLVMAEIELGHIAEPFEHPAWLGDEVSNDPRYANSALAVATAPPRPERQTASTGPENAAPVAS